jgi:hypothetical protein
MKIIYKQAEKPEHPEIKEAKAIELQVKREMAEPVPDAEAVESREPAFSYGARCFNIDTTNPSCEQLEAYLAFMHKIRTDERFYHDESAILRHYDGPTLRIFVEYMEMNELAKEVFRLESAKGGPALLSQPASGAETER